MDTSVHSISGLFEQLGLDGTRSGIYHFVKEHNIPDDVTIDEASFWSASQSSFLRDSLESDGDWSEVVDQLDAMLRK
ncbi:DUF2789 domain-containing protein [Psychrosphaera sp.]|nr:DUF2789 domain-containing protein [Psychrosphaera sp.]